MVVGAIGERADLVVIGGGPGGYAAALRGADAGLDVVLVERDALGGTCLNVGCVPSKALIEAADLCHRANRASHYGLVGSLRADMGTVTRRIAEVTGSLQGGVRHLCEQAGVRLMPGTAHFARRDRLSVAHDDRVNHVDFDDAIVATGSRPVKLPRFPLGGRVVDSTGALSLDHLPRSIAVLGGGYIGVELGTAFAKLGANVSIIEAQDSILASLAAPLRRPVERSLQALGIDVITGQHADEPHPQGVSLANGQVVDADLIIVAVGRTPASDTCSLGVAGAEITPSGHVIVDQNLEAAPGIYAIGDLIPGPALAHRATADAERAVHAILGEPTIAPTVIPEVIFSDPEIMSVGVTLDDAAAAGLTVARFPHAANARSLTMHRSDGGTWLVADEHGTVLGVHAVGPHVSELAASAALAIEITATTTDISLTVHPHPTISETIAEAAWLAQGKPLHVRR